MTARAGSGDTPILLAIVGITLIAMGAVVGVQIAHPGDNTPVITIILAALAPTVASLLVLLKSQQTNRKVEQTERKVDELHVTVNSRLTELLATTASAAHGQGVEQGTAAALVSSAALADTVQRLVEIQTKIALQKAGVRVAAAHEAGLQEGILLPVPDDPTAKGTDDDPTE